MKMYANIYFTIKITCVLIMKMVSMYEIRQWTLASNDVFAEWLSHYNYDTSSLKA